jgi:hypothetical protein
VRRNEAYAQSGSLPQAVDRQLVGVGGALSSRSRPLLHLYSGAAFPAALSCCSPRWTLGAGSYAGPFGPSEPRRLCPLARSRRKPTDRPASLCLGGLDRPLSLPTLTRSPAHADRPLLLLTAERPRELRM